MQDRALVVPIRWGVPVSDPEAQFILPAGTVTLLLADVEGSTMLWEEQPGDMGQAISSLQDVVNDAVGHHNGVRPIEQGEGDSFVAAFDRASDAVAAALAIQQKAPPPIRLRIGLHTGEVNKRDEGNYVGSAVNRAGRLRDTAHGGQTVLSQTCAELVADRLPPGAWLRDLGMHRFRDLERPQRIQQLCHPALPDEFPPLRSLDAQRHNLPPQHTSLVGRREELREIRALVESTSLVTLTGPGGCGKTRLAVHAAAELVDACPDGVWFVDLAAVTDGDAVASAVGAVLGLREALAGPPVGALVANRIGVRAMLLVLDNCEQVVDSSAALADTLLRACPGLRILTTSREPLGLAGEVTYVVPPLRVPDDRQPAPLEAMSQCEAVELFCDRAARARNGFELTADNAAAIADLCRRLDGLPLAIELAAARTRVFTPAQIRDRLNDRFRLLTGGSRTALARQQTLQASVDWSHDLLTEAERVLFRRLAVFAGGFTIDAAEAVGTGEHLDRHHVLDVLSLLVDKSLVLADDTGDVARYRMLETVRQYAARRLQEAGEHVQTRDRHLRWMMELAQRAEPQLIGPDQLTWRDRLDDETDNIATALTWAGEHGTVDDGLRIIDSLLVHWYARGDYSPTIKLIAAVIDRAYAAPAELQGRAIAVLAYLSLLAGADDIAGQDPAALADKALALARGASDARGIARALMSVGLVGLLTDLRLAVDAGREGMDAAGTAGDAWCATECLQLLGYAEGNRGDLASSRRHLEDALARYRRIGHVIGELETFGILGQTLARQGEFAAAHEVLDASIERARDAGYPIWDLLSSATKAQISLWQGDTSAARRLFEYAAQQSSRTGIFAGWWDILMSASASAIDDPRRAVELVSSAMPVLRQASLDAAVGIALLLLGEARFHLGELDAARQTFDELLRHGRAHDHPWDTAHGLLGGAWVARAENELKNAEDAGHQALALMATIGCPFGAIECLEVLAGVELELDRAAAARLLGGTTAARQRLGFEIHPLRRARWERDLEQAHAEAVQWSEGSALTLEEAISYATRGRGSRRRPPSGWDSLTPSEARVVELVAAGLSNPQIAAKLFVSARTVQTHLGHAFTKLGLHSRAEVAAAFARRNSR